MFFFFFKSKLLKGLSWQHSVGNACIEKEFQKHLDCISWYCLFTRCLWPGNRMCCSFLFGIFFGQIFRTAIFKPRVMTMVAFFINRKLFLWSWLKQGNANIEIFLRKKTHSMLSMDKPRFYHYLKKNKMNWNVLCAF